MKRHAVAKAGEIPPGGRKIVMAGSLEIGLFNVAGEIKAYRNACPHAGAPVCVGKISGTPQPSKVYEYIYGSEGCILRCPWHGWEFDLRTGRHLVDPDNKLKEMKVEADTADGLSAIATEEAQGNLYVLLPE